MTKHNKKCSRCKGEVDIIAYWKGKKVCQHCYRKLKIWARLGKKPPKDNGFKENYVSLKLRI